MVDPFAGNDGALPSGPTMPALGTIGAALLAAREARGMSLLELSVRVGVSQRHLGFVELGRARPGRELLVALLHELDVPRAMRNALMLATGFSPDARPQPGDHTEFRDSLTQLIEAHDPFPALLFNADWYGLDVNAGGAWLCGIVMPGFALSSRGVAGGFDMIDALADPAGLLSRVREPVRTAAMLIEQLHAEAWARPSLRNRVEACAAELEARYGALPASDHDPASPQIALTFETPFGDLSFDKFQIVPGIPHEVSTGSLRIELWFPRDARTRETMQQALCGCGRAA